MKKLLLSLMFIIPMWCLSQVSVDLGTGYVADSKHIPIDLQVSYTKYRTVLSANMRIDFTADSKKNDYLGGSIGYNIIDEPILRITPAFGYYYNHPVKIWYPAGFIDFATNLKKKANFYLEFGYIASPQIIFGVTFKP